MKLLLNPKKTGELKKIALSLNTSREIFERLSIDNLIEFLNKVGEFLKKDFSGKPFFHGSRNLVDFFDRDYLERTSDFVLFGNRHVLDRFIYVRDKGFQITARSKGLAAHWLSGNVPNFGIYSIILAFMTKNASIVKVSTENYKDLIKILSFFKNINIKGLSGEDVLKTICLVQLGRDQIDLQKELSELADVRIIWGGKEALDIISKFPKKNPEVTDIFFGPRYSYALITKDISARNVSDYALRLAVDVSIFDQYACSSPHTVFIEEGGPISSKSFSKILAEKLKIVDNKFIPKGVDSPKKVMEILDVRSKYLLSGKVISSEGPNWTVIYTRSKLFEEPCFGRVIFVKPIKNIDDLVESTTYKFQTIGIACESKERLKQIGWKLTKNGGTRICSLGRMTFFDIPWDGIFPIDRMVRWVTLEDEK